MFAAIGIYFLNIIDKLRLIRQNRRFKKQNPTTDISFVEVCDLSKLEVGKFTYGTVDFDWLSDGNEKLRIGCYCSIAKNVHFCLSGEHQLKAITTYPFKVRKFGYEREAGSKGDIIVGDDVWIGVNAVICSGVTIGQGAVIASGAVVTKNVEPYAIVGGNPAKIIRYRFPENIREKLSEINLSVLFDSFSKEDISLIYSELTEQTLDEILEKQRNK